MTTSGALVTLLLALTGLGARLDATTEPATSVIVLLVAAIGLFVIAAAAGLLANLPQSYTVVEVEAVRQRLKESPMRPAARAEKDVALTRLNAVAGAKRANHLKGRLLFVGITAEVLAVGCVGAAAVVIVAGH